MSAWVVYWLHDERCICLQKHGYVGISGAFMTRLVVHQRNKRFPANFEWSIIFTGTKNECLALERTLRPGFGIGWNRARGGTPAVEFTAEVREKMGASRRGKPPTDAQRAQFVRQSERTKGKPTHPGLTVLGRRRPPEEIERIAANNRGKVRSAEFRAKLGELKRGNRNRVGKRHSEETKRQISLKKRGVPVHSDEFKATLSARLRGNTYTKGKPWSTARRAAHHPRP
jgi:hypothetical protein